MSSISIDDAAVQSYIFYSAILALKMFAMALLTARQRYGKKIFANPEDLTQQGSKLKFDDPDVERVRRAHMNDLENIPAFWILGALYLTTSPVASWATLLFRLFAVFRILHTIVYAVKPLPQPARFIGYVIPATINAYMGVIVVSYYLSAW